MEKCDFLLKATPGMVERGIGCGWPEIRWGMEGDWSAEWVVQGLGWVYLGL